MVERYFSVARKIATCVGCDSDQVSRLSRLRHQLMPKLLSVSTLVHTRRDIEPARLCLGGDNAYPLRHERPSRKTLGRGTNSLSSAHAVNGLAIHARPLTSSACGAELSRCAPGFVPEDPVELALAGEPTRQRDRLKRP
jgi:hypothetical protein